MHNFVWCNIHWCTLILCIHVSIHIEKQVVYRETSRERLEAQVKEDSITYVAPKSYHSTTSEYDSVTESDGEEEEKSQRK